MTAKCVIKPKQLRPGRLKGREEYRVRPGIPPTEVGGWFKPSLQDGGRSSRLWLSLPSRREGREGKTEISGVPCVGRH